MLMVLRVSLSLTAFCLGMCASGCGCLIVTQRSLDDLRDRRGSAWTTHEGAEFTIYAEESVA
jgi:hypothetical protein